MSYDRIIIFPYSVIALFWCFRTFPNFFEKSFKRSGSGTNRCPTGPLNYVSYGYPVAAGAWQTDTGIFCIRLRALLHTHVTDPARSVTCASWPMKAPSRRLDVSGQ